MVANRREMASVAYQEAYENVLHRIDILEFVYDDVGNALA
ncbi:hypothetical protein I553_2467 [Mycobacterium xenopi 4042]|uniref:Uncharacterized protein n=1 Tax=Mycobacterium xenopi 4042 TaxID=1299334 RepID=X8C934_MYCXE|nr:hypothetical protein I553_2467 [Mycobacterium xenopi 4042]